LVLGENGIIIKTSGRNLIMAGGRPRGSLYAVHSFLEDQLGVCWWTPEASTIPTRKTLKVPPQNTLYVPQLRTREVYSSGVQRDALFATRLKINGHFQKQGPELGGHDSVLGWCHTFGGLLPTGKYFKDHPEWYSDPANGGKPCTAESKMPELWQPCLSNEAARLELTKNAIEWLRANPNATSISISQNDNLNRCTCEADLALEKTEGSPAGPLLHYVNAVAADIEKEFPHILVDTLAYQYTQKPPLLVRPRDNVVIRFCTIDADFGQPMNSEGNATFRDDMKNWRAIAPRLAVWDYVTNFANFVLPFPNMPSLGTNIRFFVENNAITLFEQSDPHTNSAGDFVDLRAWMLSHLMWDPRRDQRKLEDEFLKGYYGPAAPHLRAYLDTMQGSGKGYKLGWLQADVSFLTLDVMNKATREFRQALISVEKDPVITARIKREQLALDHAWLLRSHTLKREAQRRGVPYLGPEDNTAASLAFVKSLREYGVIRTAEGEVMEDYAKRFVERFQSNGPLPAIAQGKSDYDIIDAQENIFRLTNVGLWVSVVDDPKASNGKAAKLPGTVGEWAIQYTLEENDAFLGKEPWRCYLLARVETKHGITSGSALSAGMYDTRLKSEPLNKVFELDEVPHDGEYQLVDLGSHVLNSGMYFWVAATGRPEIEGVYVDRIVLIREKATNEKAAK
jgi:hypothetical protein